MKKQKQYVVIFCDVKNNNINLLVAPNKNLVGAKFYSQKLIGNIFCKSVFYKNITSVLRLANLNKNNSNIAKIVLPDEFFNYETVKLDNTFINNIAPKKYLKKLLPINYCLINYTKTNVNKYCFPKIN